MSVAKLKSLIESGAPVVVISSWEEGVVESIVRRAAESMGLKLYLWSAATGFGEGTTDPSPLSALKQLRKAGRALALLKDFHPYFDAPACVRLLRELAGDAGGPQIILSMPAGHVPMELEKDAAYMTVPLPEADQLRQILREAAEKAGATVPDELSERAAVAAAGLTRRQARWVYAMALESSAEGAKPQPGPASYDQFLNKIIEQKREVTRGALALEFRESGETFDHVGGLEELKQWLKSRADAFSERAREFGLPPPKGLLLLGVQGCGKSLTAKAVSDLWKLPLLRLDLSRIDPITGEQMLLQGLRTAEAVAPAVLWIDEIEKGFGRAGDVMSGVSLRSLSAFITWLQEKQAPVYVVATANSISRMPPELLRKGRFDEVFFVDLPTRDERREIFDIHLLKRNRQPEKFDVESLAAESESFSGSEIEASILAGMYEAFSQGRELTTEDILMAIHTTVPLSTTMEEEIKALKDWAKGRARPASVDTRLAELLHPQPE